MCKAGQRDTAHAWNQIRLKDDSGNYKWYYTDLTWDAGNTNYRYTLLGKNNFIRQRHEQTRTKNIENVDVDIVEEKVNLIQNSQYAK